MNLTRRPGSGTTKRPHCRSFLSVNVYSFQLVNIALTLTPLNLITDASLELGRLRAHTSRDEASPVACGKIIVKSAKYGSFTFTSRFRGGNKAKATPKKKKGGGGSNLEKTCRRATHNVSTFSLIPAGALVPRAKPRSGGPAPDACIIQLVSGRRRRSLRFFELLVGRHAATRVLYGRLLFMPFRPVFSALPRALTPTSVALDEEEVARPVRTIYFSRLRRLASLKGRRDASYFSRDLARCRHFLLLFFCL